MRWRSREGLMRKKIESDFLSPQGHSEELQLIFK